jgi:ABC-2 type transport system ATP-binding protein
VIEIRDLYKYYGDRRAIGPLNAEIQQGEIVGLLGLNGTGKTTTLRVLACDLLPTSGSVKVGGSDVVADPASATCRTGRRSTTT